MVKIIGKGSLITESISRKVDIVQIYSTSEFDNNNYNKFFQEGDAIVYVSGVLLQKRIEEQTFQEWSTSIEVNSILPIKLIKHLNKNIKNFTFCYLGSESAYKGSYDDTYYLSKLMTQTFIKDFKLKSAESRIFAIAPSTINSGMTLRRNDKKRLEEYRNLMRNKRFLEVEEISDIIIELLSEKFNYLSNEVINLDFGKKAKYE